MQAAWTWMVYMATHNNVAEAGNQSIASIERVHYDSQVRVLVQQATPQFCQRKIIGQSPTAVSMPGQVDSGEPATLVDFIRWAAATAPARRYALVLWSHGSGWEPSEMERLAQQQPAGGLITTAELVQRSADDGSNVFFTTTMRKLLALPTLPKRAIAFDDGSGHSLDTIELGQVMAQATQILGQPIDLLGMNACLMSSIEVAYQVRNYVRVYVASEDLMPAQSLPYEDILTRLEAQPDLEAVALSQLIVERYCARFLVLSPQSPVPATLTALQLASIEHVASAVHAFADALRANITVEIDAVWAAHQAAHMFRFRLCDLAGFCRALLAQTGVTPDTITAAQELLAALTDPAFLLSTSYTNRTYADTGGVSTYLMEPLPGKHISPYYAETAYAQATGWNDFLIAYHAHV